MAKNNAQQSKLIGEHVIDLVVMIWVLAGSFCATGVHFGWRSSIQAVVSVWPVIIRNQSPNDLHRCLVGVAVAAEKGDLELIESEIRAIGDTLLAQGLRMWRDGVRVDDIREILTVRSAARVSELLWFSSVIGAWSRYAILIGLILSALGISNVLGQFGQLDLVVDGLFQAVMGAVYGLCVGAIGYPIAGRLMAHGEQIRHRDALVVSGVVAIARGEDPIIVNLKTDERW